MQQLESLLKELASLYRRYGNVDVMIETPDALLNIESLDVDIFNTDPESMRVIIETEGVEEQDDDVPPTQSETQSQIPQQRAKPAPTTKRPTRSRKSPQSATR